MAEPTRTTRPQQVTFAGWVLMVCCAFVVVSAFQRVSGLRSIESQEEAARFLADAPGDSLGISVSGLLDLIQIACLVAAACATVAGILGWQVLQGSRNARLIIAILAVPLLLSGMAASGLLAAFAVGAAVTLWLPPARDWFNGVEPAPRADSGSGTPTDARPNPFATPPANPPAAPPIDTSADRAPAPWGAPQTSVAEQPQPAPPAYSSTQPTPTAGRRPSQVIWACVITWIWCGMIALLMAVSTAVVAVEPGQVLEAMRRQQPDLPDDVTEGLLVGTISVVAGLLVLWCVAAIVLAVLAFRRVRWARIGLMVCAGAAAGLSVVGILASPLLILAVGGCVFTVALLARPESKEWFARG